MQEAEHAVKRVIDRINEEFYEELTIDDLARTAMYSKFHFTRLFQRVTGLTPGRFLSAVRLQQAKQLLVTTSLTVTEICHRVGYASVGTFSSRFCDMVGASPSTFRRLGGSRPEVPLDDRPRGAALGTIRGTVSLPESCPGDLVFIGVFPGPIHQGRPVSHTVLRGPGPYLVGDVPEGEWYVMACCEVANDAAPLLVASHGPMAVRGDTVHLADLGLRPPGELDPPVLLAPPAARPAPARSTAA